MTALACCAPALLLGALTAPPDSLTGGDRPWTSRLSFARVLDIYDWQLRAGYVNAVTPRTIFRLQENFLSSLHRLSAQDRWKDDQNATVGVEVQMLGTPLQAQLSSRRFRDQISSFNSNFNNSAAQVGWQRYWKRLAIKPSLGYRWESRLRQYDHGPHAELAAQLPETTVGGYTHELEASAATDRFPARVNEDVRLEYSLSRQFYRDTSDSLLVTFAHFRRDNYVSERQQIRVEELSKRTRGVENRLRYRFYGNGRLALRSLVQESRVAISRAEVGGARKPLGSRAHDDFDVLHHLHLEWQGSRLSSSLEFRFEQQTVDFNIPDSAGFSPFSSPFVILRYNVRDRTYSIAQRTTWQPTRRDSLQLSGSMVRLARDTSERNRPDSYDNFRAQASLTHHHFLRPGLALRWQLSGYADHLVYLKSAFSATNNWTRILQLSPQVYFRIHDRVRGSQRVGVRAHYVTYDFDAIPGTPKSFSSRTFFVQDSLVAELTPRSTLGLQYQLELEEIGSLNWHEFVSRPQLSRERHWLYLAFEHRPARRWHFAPGLAFYQQTQWRHEATPAGLRRRRNAQLTSVGPQLRVAYERPPHALLTLQARQQTVEALEAPRQMQYYFNLIVQWSF